jgi:hypothetical protein
MNVFKDNTKVYPKIYIGWGYRNETELMLKDRTLADAYDMAVKFGLKPFRWYNPMTWFSGLWVVTVG